MVFTLRLYSSRPDLHGRLPVYNFTFNLKGKEMHYPSMYVQNTHFHYRGNQKQIYVQDHGQKKVSLIKTNILIM